MIALLLGLFSHAESPPPADFDAEQIDLWENRARAAASGTDQGCFELTGRARTQIKFFLPALSFAPADTQDLMYEGPLEATYNGGVWTRFHVDLRAADGSRTDGDTIVGPVLGTMGKAGVTSAWVDPKDAAKQAQPASETDPDESSVSISIGGDEGVSADLAGASTTSALAELLDGALTDQPTVSYVSWDGERKEVELVVEAAIDEEHPNDPITTKVRFPRGEPVPTSYDTGLERRVSFREGPFTIRVLAFDVQARGRAVGSELLPTVERVTGAVGVMGLTVGYEQVLLFHAAKRCATSGE